MLDPAGLLSRIPELSTLLVHDTRLQDAVATGNAHRAFSRLHAAGQAGGGDARALALRLGQQPHRFYRALPGRLVEWSVLGVGPGFARQRAIPFAGNEASTTFGFRVLGLMLWPVVEVVVGTDAQGRDFVIGELPPRWLPRFFRGTVTIVATAVLVLLATLSVRGWATSHAFVVNGLDVAVSARLGEHELALAPGGVAHLELVGGSYGLHVVRPDGKVVESRTIQVDASQAATVINVLGAAPVVEVAGDGTSQVHCAAALLARGNVGTAFAFPIGNAKSALALGSGGWRACVQSLTEGGRNQEAATLARGAAAQASESVEGIELASQLVRHSFGHEEDVDWLRKVADERPLDLGVQRIFLGALRRAKLPNEALERYAQLQAANPGSATAAALHYDAEPSAEARQAILTGALGTFPGDAELLRRLGMSLLAVGRWNEAGEALTAAVLANGALADELRPAIVSAWIAAGRATDAAAQLVNQDGMISTDQENIRLYIANARRAPRRVSLSAEQAAAQYRSAAEARSQDGEAREMAIWLSLGDDVLDARLLAVPGPADRAYLQALARLGRDPVVALRRIEGIGDDGLAHLDGTSWILFRGESISAGRTALQVRLDRACPLSDEAAEAVRAYVAGSAELNTLEPLLPEQRAAAVLARSRQAYARKDAGFLRVSAMQLDPLRGIVTVAAQRWPPNR